jgi:DNA-binding ferritin-like protein
MQAAAPAASTAGGTGLPVLPPDIPQYFVLTRGSRPTGNLLYKPVVFGAAQVNFADAKSGINTQDDCTAFTEITDDPIPVNWDNGKDADFSISDLEKAPQGPAQFTQLPAVAGKARSYDTWGKAYVTWIYGSKKFELFKSPTYKQFSKPGESERDFRVRLGQAVREQRDDMMEKLRQKYQAKIATLDERLRKAQQAVDREAEQKKQQTMQTVISVGSTLLGAFLGGKALGTGTVGRATTAARSAGRIFKEGQDIERAKDTVEAHQQTLDEIEKEFKAETDELAAKTDPATEELQTISIRPAKKDIIVKLVGLAWLPYWKTPDGILTPAWQ